MAKSTTDFQSVGRLPAGPTKATNRLPSRMTARWLFLSLLIVYITLTRGHFQISDEVQVYEQARSLWEHGDLAVTPNVNAMAGRGGQYFAPYGIGQSVLAVPFYVVGKAVHGVLDSAGAQSWIRTFAPPVPAPDAREGGGVEIFFVNLFNAFAVAGLAAVFLVFSLRLGTPPRSASAATFILALATHVEGFSGGFLQHGSEALFLLWTFYLLFLNSQQPNWRTSLVAGAAAAMMVLIRASTLIAIPILTAYLLWTSVKRLRASVVAQSVAFLLPVAGAALFSAFVNSLRWGTWSLSGSYPAFINFETPLAVSIYGYLFSPGQSIFLFSPILVLAPVYFRWFWRRYPAETAAILTITLLYPLFYGRASSWHGQWCFGPRFLMPLLPLLLLPLGGWLATVRSGFGRLGIATLVLIGAFIEVLHTAVNVVLVYFREGYDRFVPPYGFIFLPQSSQIAAHFRAILAWDERVDMWLINVARQAGTGRVLTILLPLLVLLGLCLHRLFQHIANARAADLFTQPAQTR